MLTCYIDVIKRPARHTGAQFIRSQEIKMYTNRFFSFLVIAALVVVFVLTLQEAVATQAVAFAPEVEEAQRQRIRAADAASWTAMGEYYENVEAAKPRRSRDADIARWMGQAE